MSQPLPLVLVWKWSAHIPGAKMREALHRDMMHREPCQPQFLLGWTIVPHHWHKTLAPHSRGKVIREGHTMNKNILSANLCCAMAKQNIVIIGEIFRSSRAMALKAREIELDQRHSSPLPSPQTPDTTKPEEKSALSGLVLKRSPSWSSQSVSFLEIKAFSSKLQLQSWETPRNLRFQLSQSWWNLKLKSFFGATGEGKWCNTNMSLWSSPLGIIAFTHIATANLRNVSASCCAAPHFEKNMLDPET